MPWRSDYKEIEIFEISRVQGWNIQVLLQHTEDKGFVLRKKKMNLLSMSHKIANNTIVYTYIQVWNYRYEIHRKENNKYLKRCSISIVSENWSGKNIFQINLSKKKKKNWIVKVPEIVLKWELSHTREKT